LKVNQIELKILYVENMIEQKINNEIDNEIEKIKSDLIDEKENSKVCSQ
jgi:hypothetical protein